MTGLGFGFSNSNHQYKTLVTVDGNVIGENDINLTQRKTMIINIPNSLIKSKFQKNVITYLPVVITSEISQMNSFGKIKTKKFITKFNLVLMPTIAGYIVVKETISHKILDGINVTQSISRNYKGCSSENPCQMIEEWSCSINQKIVNVRYSCVGQCGWSYNSRKGGSSADYDILNDGMTAKVYRRIDGHKSTTVTYYIDYQNYINKYTDISRDSVYLRYDEPLDVLLNQNNLDCNYIINGRLFTGQVININNNTITSSPHLKLLGIGKVGNNCKATFKLEVPK
jgi:hypothetical protein